MSEQTPDFLPNLVGSMSEGAKGNPTVEMIEAAFRHHALHYRYINMEVSSNDLAEAIKGARAMGFKGFNCSLPHKVTVIPHLDGLGRSAEIMGAVNCVVKRGDQFIGENTDGKGFLESLKSVIQPDDKHVVILGAGGAARAIAVELGLAGAGKITVVNRNQERGSELSQLLQDKLNVSTEYIPWDTTFKIPITPMFWSMRLPLAFTMETRKSISALNHLKTRLLWLTSFLIHLKPGLSAKLEIAVAKRWTAWA
jgi:shikimate dehydrogenase